MLVTQLDKGNAFRTLHHGPRAFIIPNAWDAGSTRILAGFGFSAIATSSWASANVYGRRDHGMTRERALAPAIEQILLCETYEGGQAVARARTTACRIMSRPRSGRRCAASRPVQTAAQQRPSRGCDLPPEQEG